ncbi:hypothetical protein SEVIR_J004012v4 [Setaria viridis]|uniref:Uncharacterized protein n=1 Tax=Setaria viridis TaxID=4556 RepID=A0ACC3P2K0_SETVI
MVVSDLTASFLLARLIPATIPSYPDKGSSNKIKGNILGFESTASAPRNETNSIDSIEVSPPPLSYQYQNPYLSLGSTMHTNGMKSTPSGAAVLVLGSVAVLVLGSVTAVVEIPVSVASVPGIRSVPSSAKALVESY